MPSVRGEVSRPEIEFPTFPPGRLRRDLEDMAGSFLVQDLSIAVGQQRGFHSRGYTDAHLSGQEIM